jgi:hypothetical protein
MKNTHPVELLVLAAMVAAAALLELTVALVALLLTVAGWRPAPARPQRTAPRPPAPPAVAPLFDDLAHLTTRQLMALAGTRSKKHRRAELLAMVAAC